jgi:spermidine synthase
MKKGPHLLRGVAAILAFSSAVHAKVLYERQSLYHYIRVEQTGSVRTLGFRRTGVEYDESQVDIADPLRLVMRYSRLMCAGFLFCPEPKKVLVVGLGGGTLSRMTAHYFPDAQVDSVEIDPDVVEVARKYFLFRESKNIRVFVRDGRVQIKSLVRQKAKYDIIMLDAFRGGYIPYHLTTKEFLEECRSILSPGGVVVANLRPGFLLYEYQRRTFAKVFKSDYAFGGGDNKILVALPQKVSLTQSELYDRAKKLQERHIFSFEMKLVVDEYDPRVDYSSKGDILVDGHAPANILRSQPLR